MPGSSAPSTEGVGADHLAIPQAQDALIPAAPERQGDVPLLQQERTVHKDIDIAKDVLTAQHLVGVSGEQPDVRIRRLLFYPLQKGNQHTLIFFLAGLTAENRKTLYP